MRSKLIEKQMKHMSRDILSNTIQETNSDVSLSLPSCLWMIIFDYLNKTFYKDYISKSLICKVCYESLKFNLNLNLNRFKNIHNYVKELQCCYNYNSSSLHSNNLKAEHYFKEYYFKARQVLDIEFSSYNNNNIYYESNIENESIKLKKFLKKYYKRVIIYKNMSNSSNNGYLINVIGWNEKK